MTGMTDQNRVATLMNWLYHGGSAPTITQPYHLRQLTATGTNTAAGTEATGSNCPGYTAGGASLGNPSFSAVSSGVSASANSVSWTATGGWVPIAGVEVWDTAATPLRWAQGPISSVSLANGNTLSYAAASVTLDWSQA